MPNIELLEKSMPVAPIRIAALDAENLQKKLTENLLNSVKSWLNANSSVLFLRDTAKNHLL